MSDFFIGIKLNDMNDVFNKIEIALSNNNSAVELENIVYESKGKEFDLD
jgi:hypothetical protein